MQRIIVVDDEKIYTRIFVTRLRLSGYKVDVYDNVSSARNTILAKPPGAISLVVSDMMMPPDDLYDEEESLSGMVTGLCLAEDLRNSGFHSPVFIFTAFKKGLETIKKRVKAIPDVYLLSKRDFDEDEFAECVEAFLERGKDPDGGDKMIVRFLSSLLLEPNFSGFGINLRKLFKK